MMNAASVTFRPDDGSVSRGRLNGAASRQPDRPHDQHVVAPRFGISVDMDFQLIGAVL